MGRTHLLFIFAAALQTIAFASTSESISEGELSVELTSKFHMWTQAHGKFYDDHKEQKERLRIWAQNDARIHEHNNQNPTPSFKLGHNAFSDMTQDEFASYFKLGDHSHPQNKPVVERIVARASTAESRRLFEEHAPSPLQLPDYVNWLAQGAVTPVKNQGACGSCWAFSTTGALEGAKAIKTGELVSLSEQNLLDCDHVDLGCNGGLMDDAFKFDKLNGGICSEAEYPYEAKQNLICNVNCTHVPGTAVTTFIDVPVGDEKALLAAVAMQPVSIAIQANQFVFQFYKEGVLTDESCGQRGDIDHGVLAVGYGSDIETGDPYFLVKNSWGETWGENGYIRLGRGSKNTYGMCAILRMASFPVVEA